MKKLLFLLLFLPFLGNSQATFTAPVGYNTGVPIATPSGVGTRWRFDLLTGKKYTWLPGTLSWDEDARGIDQVAGCSAPLYTPGYNQSTFAVNSCTVPELYQWTGAAWVRLNEGEVYTAGTGISISGGNEISNTAPDQTVTMTDGTGIDVTGTYPNFTVTNTSPNIVQTLSIAGQDLTLSNGGGTVAIPAGADGNGIYDGGGAVANNAVAEMRKFSFKTEDDPTYNGDGFSSELQFGGYYLANGDYFPYPGYASFVAGIPAPTGNWAQFQFNGEENSVYLQGFENTNVSSVIVSGEGININKGPNASLRIIDNSTDGLGATYAADYSATIVTNPTSITDVTSVNLLKQTPVEYDNASAPNNCIFYSTTLSKLAYKDPGGTVNPLY